MKLFIELNWVVLVVTLAILYLSKVLEDKNKLITKSLKVEYKSFAVIIIAMAVIISITNYVAIAVFGSWTIFIISILVLVALTYAILYALRTRKEDQNKTIDQ